MNFDEAEMRLYQLNVQLNKGTISKEEFISAVNQLRVADSFGVWWQPDPAGQGWRYYIDNKWVLGVPPKYRSPLATDSEHSHTQEDAGVSPRSFSEFRSRLIDFKTFRTISREVPLAKRPQQWWDYFSILGGVIGAALWLVYSKEVIDLITPLLMIAIPIALVWFRTPIDNCLLPLQPTRKKVPKMVRIGVGIAIPFFTAYFLYNTFHIIEYSFIRLNLIIGTFIAYAIIRDPFIPFEGRKNPASGGMQALFLLAVILVCIVPVLADDCARDPTRAEDCLRTPGFAEMIAGTAAAGLSFLVNGPIIIQSVAAAAGTTGLPPLQGPSPPPTGYFSNGNPYWGTGSREDPFRDYPDAEHPPYMPSPDGKTPGWSYFSNKPIWGTGTKEDPFRDTPPPVFDHAPTPPDTSPTPAGMTSTPPGMTPQIPAHTQVTPSIPKEPVKPQVSTDTLKRPAQPPEIPAPPIPQPPVTPVAPETKPPIAPKPSETKKTEPDGEQKTPLDIASEKLSWAKDTLDYVGKGLDALKEDNKPGGLSDKGKEALDNIIDILKKFTDKTGEYVEKTKDYVDNSTEYNNKVENLKKNCEKINQNILDLHKKTEDIPMDQRSRAAVSGLIGAVDVTTRAFDAYLRSKGTLGGKIADTLNAPEAGKNTSEALANTIKNITKTKMTLIEEANEGDEVARAILDDGELDKYEEQIERQKEIKKILDEEAAKKEDLKRFHPPPGSVETNYWHPWNWWKVL